MSKGKGIDMPEVFAGHFRDAFQRHGVDTKKVAAMYKNGVGDADEGAAYEITPMFSVGVMGGQSTPGVKCKIAAADFMLFAYGGQIREVLPQAVLDAYEEDLKAYAARQKEMGDKGFIEGPAEGILDENGNHVSVDGAGVSTDDKGDGGDKKSRKGGRKGGKKGGDAGDVEGG